MADSSLVDLLGERRQLGHAQDVADLVLRDTSRFPELFDAMLHPDPGVAARACDALERLSRARPDLLVPLRHRLVAEAGASERPEIKRNVARMLARVRLEPKERSKAIKLLERYRDEAHDGVALEAMQTLTDYAMNDLVLRRRVVPAIEKRALNGPPVMKARVKKMSEKLRAVAVEAPPVRAGSAPATRRTPARRPARGR